MSCLFIVIPVVAGGWPIVSAAFAVAAPALGYHLIRSVEEVIADGGTAAAARLEAGVSLTLGDAAGLAGVVDRGESMTAQRDGLTAVFRRDGRGQCTVHVTGAGRSEAELHAAGQELVDRLTQQFAYARLMEQLEERGFDVVQEAVEADQTIRVRVRRWA